MFTSRRARIATLIAAGVIGFGGVAAAGPAAQDLFEQEPPEEEIVEEPAVDPTQEPAVDDEIDEVEDEVEEVEDEVEDEIEDEVDEVDDVVVDQPVVMDEETTVEPPDPDESTEFNEAYCIEGNHGATVSAAARGGNADLEKYEQHVVAQSSCGKMDDSEEETEDEVETEVEVDDETEVEEAPEQEEVEEPAAPSRGRSDQAPGQRDGKTNNGNKNNGGGGGNGKKGG